ncbi:hypothetical protein BKA83DRAFT_4485686 [Pisolithus microcarpus]|nr:hypothetical protein BKA83DRAFT_4485686 [Pisolithus microcarpus]
MRRHSGICQVKVRRNHIFEDSYAKIMKQAPSDLKDQLMIKFDGEGGLNYGGLSRLRRRGDHTLQIGPAFGVNSEHLNYFEFIGRCFGLAIFHRCIVDAYFSASVYKTISRKKVILSDLESVDAELHRSLTWMLENDIACIIDKAFITTEERFGKLHTIELKAGDVVEYRSSKRVKDQFEAFMSSFSELIPLDSSTVFDERELELLIGGTSKIDMDDWCQYTKYRGYGWFWKCTSLVNGFKDLQGAAGSAHFSIEESGELPKSHICFHRIDLPPYKDYASLEQELMLAVENTVGLDPV